jgi:hypothetical protein
MEEMLSRPDRLEYKVFISIMKEKMIMILFLKGDGIAQSV